MTLKDRIFKITEESIASAKAGIESSDVFAKEQSRLDALNALMNLGYARNEAEKLIREVLKENPDKDLTTEELGKKALLFITG